MEGPAAHHEPSLRSLPCPGLPALFLAALLSTLPAQAYPIDAGLPVYDLIRRLSQRSDILRHFLGSLPLQDTEILSILRAAADGTSHQPPRDRRELDRHLRAYEIVAFVAGAKSADFLVPASSLTGEYARVEPWLLGHLVYNNQPQHHSTLLGRSLPPNSHAFRVRWWKALPRDVEAGIEYGRLQRQLRDPGSSVFDVHSDSTHGIHKDLLGEDPETRHAVRATAIWSTSRYAETRVAVGFLKVTRWKSQQGVSLTTPTLATQAVFRYSCRDGVACA